MTKKQIVYGFIGLGIFVILVYLPEAIAKFTDFEWKNKIKEAPWIYIYSIVVVLASVALDSYYSSLSNAEKEHIEGSKNKALRIITLIPTTMFIIYYFYG